MKKSRFLLLPAFALAACTSAPHTAEPLTAAADHATHGVVFGQPINHVITMAKDERAPAGQGSSRWVSSPEAVVVGVNPGGGRAGPTRVELRHVWSYEEVDYNNPRFCTYQDVVASTIQTEVYTNCPEAHGSSPLWDAFYNGGGDRAQSLANAIAGIGPSSARSLMAAGYFNRKPRTWQAFCSELERAATAGVIQRQNYTQACITTYRQQNFQALGYEAGSCQVVTQSTPVWIEGPVTVSGHQINKDTDQECGFNNVVREQTMDDSTYRNVTVIVANPQLQAFERDQVSVVVDPVSKQISSVQGGPYTHYSYSVAQAPNDPMSYIVTLQGNERMQVNLPQAAHRGGSLILNGQTARFTITIDPQYIPHTTPTDRLIVSYRIQTCDPGFFLGINCNSRTTRSVMGPNMLLTAAQSNIDFQIPNYHHNERVRVFYSIFRDNSHFYNNIHLGEFQTDEVQVH